MKKQKGNLIEEGKIYEVKYKEGVWFSTGTYIHSFISKLTEIDIDYNKSMLRFSNYAILKEKDIISMKELKGKAEVLKIRSE